jgi:hypothetical protein
VGGISLCAVARAVLGGFEMADADWLLSDQVVLPGAIAI